MENTLSLRADQQPIRVRYFYRSSDFDNDYGRIIGEFIGCVLAISSAYSGPGARIFRRGCHGLQIYVRADGNYPIFAFVCLDNSYADVNSLWHYFNHLAFLTGRNPSLLIASLRTFCYPSVTSRTPLGPNKKGLVQIRVRFPDMSDIRDEGSQSFIQVACLDSALQQLLSRMYENYQRSYDQIHTTEDIGVVWRRYLEPLWNAQVLEGEDENFRFYSFLSGVALALSEYLVCFCHDGLNEENADGDFRSGIIRILESSGRMNEDPAYWRGDNIYLHTQRLFENHTSRRTIIRIMHI